jgi:hypothetical protein
VKQMRVLENGNRCRRLLQAFFSHCSRGEDGSAGMVHSSGQCDKWVERTSDDKRTYPIDSCHPGEIMMQHDVAAAIEAVGAQGNPIFVRPQPHSTAHCGRVVALRGQAGTWTGAGSEVARGVHSCPAAAGGERHLADRPAEVPDGCGPDGPRATPAPIYGVERLGRGGRPLQC